MDCSLADEAVPLRLTVAFMSMLSSAGGGTATFTLFSAVYACNNSMRRIDKNVFRPPEFHRFRAPLKPLTWNPVWMCPCLRSGAGCAEQTAAAICKYHVDHWTEPGRGCGVGPVQMSTLCSHELQCVESLHPHATGSAVTACQIYGWAVWCILVAYMLPGRRSVSEDAIALYQAP